MEMKRNLRGGGSATGGGASGGGDSSSTSGGWLWGDDTRVWVDDVLPCKGGVDWAPFDIGESNICVW